MKKFLAIDTSSSYLTVIASGEKTVVSHQPDCAGSHSVKLLPCVEETLHRAGITLSDCDFFAVVTGAGSFTGIRIGISTVKGFCTGTAKEALPVTSFEAIAYTTGEKTTLSVLSAGHGFAYLCGFDRAKKVVYPPSYKSLEEAEQLAADFEAVAGFEEIPLPKYQRADMAQGLLAAVSKKSENAENFIPCEELKAVYVRKSQAEENRK